MNAALILQLTLHVTIVWPVAGCSQVVMFAGADPGFDRGGPDRDRPKLPTVCSSIV